MANETLDLAAILSEYDTLSKPAPLTTPETIQGFARSYLAGPTFNFADEAEAAIAGGLKSLPLVGTGLGYSQNYADELAQIRAEQARFKEAVPYLDNAVEIGSGVVLNPIGALGKALQGAKTGVQQFPAITQMFQGTRVADTANDALQALSKIKGAQTLGTALKSAPAQGAISGIGLAEGNENIAQSAGLGALLGSAGSALATVGGKALEKTGLNANRFKLSAFGVGQADIGKQIKKLKGGIEDIGDDLPIVNSINRYEKAGIINAGDDVLDNLKKVALTQDNLATKLTGVLDEADAVLPPTKGFKTPHTEAYIKSLSGSARDETELAAIKEYSALVNQMDGGGSLNDLQKLKVGLNYKYDTNPYSEDIIKTLRSDLKEEIERRVNDAAKKELISPKAQGLVKQLNREWGDLAEVKDVFARGVGRKYGGNAVEDTFGAIRTSGGAGSLNIASATSGNIIPAAIGGLLTAARGPEALSSLGSIAREFQTPLEKAGRVIPELFSARNITQGIQDKLKGEKVAPSPDQQLNDLQELFKQYEAIKAPTEKRKEQTASIFDEMFGVPTAQAAEMPKYKAPTQTSTIESLFSGVPMPTESPKPRDSLYKAVIAQESGGKADAVSNVGAVGLMQVMPATAREIAKELGVKDYDLKDPETNKRFGQYYLDKLLNMFDGDAGLALTAYHSGPGRVRQLIKKSGGRTLEDILSVPFKEGGLGPVGRKYAKQVLARIPQDTALA